MQHAKKSLLIPIIALFSVVAIIAGCYMAQAFTAHAEEKALLESTNSAPEGSATAVAAEEATPNIIKTENGALPNFVGNKVYANIKFSTGELLYGSSEKQGQGNYPFIPTTQLAYTFTSDGGKIDFIDTQMPLSGGEILLRAIDTDFGPIDTVHIKIPENKYVQNCFLNFIGNDSVDITIVLNTQYQICFDANGGKFYDGTTYMYVWQGEGDYLVLPDMSALILPSANMKFGGWYTQRFGGEQVFAYSQTPDWGTYPTLYAHWIPVAGPNQELNVRFMSDSMFKQFHYELSYAWWSDPFNWYNISEGEGNASYLDLSDLLESKGFEDTEKLTAQRWHVIGYNPVRAAWGGQPFTSQLGQQQQPNFGTNTCVGLVWDGGTDRTYALNIYARDGEHIDWAALNGQLIPETSQTSGLGTNNRVVIATAMNVPGYFSVTSDDGSLFKCTIDEIPYSGGFGERTEFVSDFVPIFVSPDETVTYVYGVNLIQQQQQQQLMSNANNEDELNNIYGVPFTITVAGQTGSRVYSFSDNIVNIFDWFNINSHIHGVSLDGEEIPYSTYRHTIDNGYHTLTFRMSEAEFDTTVTYDANGGAFADGSTAMTLDATYGEPLPAVETPALANYDFAGWYTEKEGGFKVDPADFHWMPWQREGVTLYAHWAEKPVPPVPPEPVPPEPVPPTPDPVNPDVPGGGGTAQTGDFSIAYVYGLVFMLMASGAYVLRRKKSN